MARRPRSRPYDDRMSPASSPRNAAIGAAYALTGAFLFGVNGSVSKVVVSTGVSPEQLTLARCAAATLIAGGWLAATRWRSLAVSGRELASFAALGVAGLAMVQWLYTVAISLLPVGVALLFEYTAVVIVALFAWLVWREPVARRLWLAIGAVLAGLALVAQVWDSHLRPLGVLAGLGAAGAFAFYFLAGERGVARRPPLVVSCYASAFATAFWLAASRWWELAPASLAEPTDLQGSLAGTSLPLWALVLWVATLGGFAPFLLSFMALRHLSATAVGVLYTSEVLFAFLFAWIWLGETLTTVQIAGAAVVFAGIVIAQTARPAPAQEQASPVAVAGGSPLAPAGGADDVRD